VLDPLMPRAVVKAARLAVDVITSRIVVFTCTTAALAGCTLWLFSNGGPISANHSAATQQKASGEAGAPAGGQSLAAASGSGSTAVSDPVVLRIQCALPAELWVTNARGQSVGLNPVTHLVRMEISRASYSGHGTDPQLLTLPNASGTYRVTLVGLSSGMTQVAIQASRPGDLAHVSRFSGGAPIAAGQQLSDTVRVTPTTSSTPGLSVTNFRSVYSRGR